MKKKKDWKILKQVSLVAKVGSGWKGCRSLVGERNCGGSARQLGKNLKLM